jgi:UDP-N-acetyl-D-mannosaminuronate dehydrogenase
MFMIPLVSSLKIKNLNLVQKIKFNRYDLIIIAVNHDIFKNEIFKIKKNKLIILNYFRY